MRARVQWLQKSHDAMPNREIDAPAVLSKQTKVWRQAHAV